MTHFFFSIHKDETIRFCFHCCFRIRFVNWSSTTDDDPGINHIDDRDDDDDKPKCDCTELYWS
jgi:hypothetical protein